MNSITANTHISIDHNSILEKAAKFVIGTTLALATIGLFILTGEFLFQNAHSLAMTNIGVNFTGF